MANQDVHPVDRRRFRPGLALAATLLVASLAGVAGADIADAAVAPTVSVDQTSDLIDGQSIEVSVSGLDPADEVGVFQCTAGVPTSDCDAGQLGSPAPDGSFVRPFTVHRFLGDGTDCAVADCVVRVAYGVILGDPGQIDTPIGFAAGGSSGAINLDTRVLTVAADGSGTVTGTLYCDPEADGTVSVSVSRGEVTVVAPPLAVRCGPELGFWSVTFPSGLDALPNGPATITVALRLPGSESGLAAPITIVQPWDLPMVELPDETVPAPPSAPTVPPATAGSTPGAATPVAAQPTFTG